MLRTLVPGAEVHASTWDEFVPYMQAARSALPVVSDEIGDTWIHGCQSDPIKLAQFRAASRLRVECEAMPTSACPRDERYYNFSRLLIKVSEHTWGGDAKKFLPDYLHWDNVGFQKMLASG